MGMGLNIAGVNHQPFEIGVIDHRLQQSGPHSTVPPAAEAPVGVLPVSVVRRQIPPGRSGAQNPAHGVDEPTVVMGRSALLALSPGRCGLNRSQTSSVISWRRCAARILPTLQTLPTHSNLSPSHCFDDTPTKARMDLAEINRGEAKIASPLPYVAAVPVLWGSTFRSP